MSYSFLRKVLKLVIISFIFTGCYEDYIVIHSNFKSGKISQDSSQVFFFHSLQIGQPPKGISRFPDGGTQKILFKNVSIYCYNMENQTLEKVFDFGNLPFGSWTFNLSLQNNSLLFGVCPLAGWDWRIKHPTRSEVFKILYDKYMGIYKYDFENEKLEHFVYDGYYQELSNDENQIIYLKRDSLDVEIWHLMIAENKNQIIKKLETNTAFIPIYWINNDKIAYKANNKLNLFDLETGEISLIDKELIPKQNDISITEIIELTNNISFNDWGFKLDNYWQRSYKEYINDIIHLNGNLNYRRAIIEEVGQNMSSKEIEEIINKIDRYKNSLDGYKQTNYEFFSKETVDLLNDILEPK